MPSSLSLCLAVAILPVVAAPVHSQTAPSAEALIARAADAMGGAAALELRGRLIEFHSAMFALGQEETDGSPPRTTVSFGRQVVDFAGGRQLTVQELRPSGQVNRQRRVTLPAMSLLETNGAQQMEPPAVAAALERARSLLIEQIMLAAVHHPAAASLLRPRTLRGEVADGIRMLLGPDTVSVWFDRGSGLPLATERVADDDILGDRRTLTWYTRWQDAGGLLLPRQIDVEVNGQPLSHTVITRAEVNPVLDESEFAIPDSMAARAPRGPTGPAPVQVVLTELGPGVWWAGGGSHHSLVVEQADGLLVIEAPQSGVRGRAVLDTLASRFPGRRVTGVVVTHHHHDHTGGVRAFQARGIRVIAHRRHVGFIRGIAAAQKTVAPDRLSRGAAPPPVVPVGDSLVLGSGAGRVVLHRLPTTHAEGVLAAWVPSAGVVFTSDVLNPAAGQPLPRTGTAELVAWARRLGIAPARFAGGHGVAVDWAAVVAAGS